MRKFLALVLALVMTMSLVTVSAGAATDFTDDAAITNAEAVEVLNAIGILGGYADGSFRPNATLTRGAGAKMIAYLMLGQEAADNLKATYTVFEDVTDTVGLAPYIEWAAANGIVGGYGDGNFGPYNTLTEYAFGKMLLTAIGFDADEQGYTGAGWQKAVYRDAVAKNIYDGTETFGACTRDTAAGMAFNTLKTTYVVYGEKTIEGRYEINGVWYDLEDVGVTVNGVHSTVLPVWATYDDLVYNAAAMDKWGNLGERWIYEEEEIAFFEDEVESTYTEQVDYCDLLVDLGIGENSSKKAVLLFAYNGDSTYTTESYPIVDEDWADEFDYDFVDEFIVDGEFDFEADGAPNYAVVGHEDVHYTCDDLFIGGQGVLTKVFATDVELTSEDLDVKNADVYVVTEIATYLAQASTPVKTHNTTYTTEFTFNYRPLTGFGEGTADVAEEGERDMHSDVFDVAGYEEDMTVDVETNAYAKDDFALLTIEIDDDDKLVVDAHKAVTGKVAKLTNYKTDVQNSPEVGTTNKTPDAFGFDMGYDLVKTNGNLGKNYVFYFDTYGNVIGAHDPADATSYGVLDAVWSDHTEGDAVVGGNFVTLDGTNNKKVNIVSFNDAKASEVKTRYDDEVVYGGDVVLSASNLNTEHAYRLYSYTVADGKYTIEIANDDIDGSADDAHYIEGVAHVAKSDKLVDGDGEVVVELTAKTKFIVRDMNKEYHAYTGYNALPALTAEYADVVYVVDAETEEETVLASVVYLHNVAFEGDKVFGYVVNPEFTGGELYSDGNKYYTYEIYVNGVAREVLVDTENMEVIDSEARGMYVITFNAVDGKLAVNDIAKAELEDGYITDETISFVDLALMKIKFAGSDEYFKLDDAKVYTVDTTSRGTDVNAAELSELAVAEEEGKTVEIILAEDANDDFYVAAIYVINERGV